MGGVVVGAYEDHATATMALYASGGGGASTEAVLRPEPTVADETLVETARALHAEVSARCLIPRAP